MWIRCVDQWKCRWFVKSDNGKAWNFFVQKMTIAGTGYHLPKNMLGLFSWEKSCLLPFISWKCIDSHLCFQYGKSPHHINFFFRKNILPVNFFSEKLNLYKQDVFNFIVNLCEKRSSSSLYTTALEEASFVAAFSRM